MTHSPESQANPLKPISVHYGLYMIVYYPCLSKYNLFRDHNLVMVIIHCRTYLKGWLVVPIHE